MPLSPDETIARLRRKLSATTDQRTRATIERAIADIEAKYPDAARSDPKPFSATFDHPLGKPLAKRPVSPPVDADTPLTDIQRSGSESFWSSRPQGTPTKRGPRFATHCDGSMGDAKYPDAPKYWSWDDIP